MYIAMNRFKVPKEEAKAFEDLWRTRDPHLDEVPGFIVFRLLKGAAREDHILYLSHMVWASREAYTAWATAEESREAQADAGENLKIFAEPQFEGFEVIQTSDIPHRRAAE